MDASAHPARAPGALRHVVVWLGLLALTVATLLLAEVEMGRTWSLAVALLIAASKAVLVALFFMHLWDGEGTNRMVLLVSLFFVLLLIAGVVGDMATRQPLARPPEATGLLDAPRGRALPSPGNVP